MGVGSSYPKADNPVTAATVTLTASHATAGTAFTSQAAVNVTPAGATGYTVAYSLASGLGLTINATTGAISGTATGAGTVTVNAVITNDDATTVNATAATITVAAATVSGEMTEAETPPVMASHYQAVQPLPEKKKKGKK